MFVGRMKKRLPPLLLLIVMIAIWATGCAVGQRPAEAVPPAAPPERQAKLEALNQTADELYKGATTGALTEARGKLDRYAELVADIPFTGIATIEGVNELTNAVVQAKRAFQAVRPDPDQIVRSAAILKLSADTLTHPHEPMWLQYYKVLSEDTKLLDQAIQSGQQEKAQSALNRLKDHYGTVRPSVWLSRTPSESEQMDSLLTFFTKYTDAGSFRQEILANGLGQWKTALDRLFKKSGEQTVYMPGVQPDRPVVWTLTVGSLIVTVLLYAAWRMFMGNGYSVPRSRDGL